jgi:hypothetical protein
LALLLQATTWLLLLFEPLKATVQQNRNATGGGKAPLLLLQAVIDPLILRVGKLAGNVLVIFLDQRFCNVMPLLFALLP